MRREERKTVRVIMKMNVKGKIGRGRPKKKWLDTIENMRAVCVGVNVENRDEWRFRKKIVNPK
jgi:hypothetical protein